MAVTKIRGNTQIIDGTIVDAQISSSAAIATSKLADGSNFIKRDGSVEFTADQSMGLNRITNLAAPQSDNDAARKIDVDTAAAGLDLKQSVRAATTTSGTLASSFANGSVIDGVTLSTGDRILIKNQVDATENGIYIVNASGAPTRAPDADTDAEVNPGMFCFVEEGTVLADTGWVLITNSPITLGTTELTFTQFSGAGVGDVSSASNVNVGGVGVFKQLTGSNLEFRGINSAPSGKVTVTLDDANNEIDLDIGAGTLVDADLSASAAISRSKIATGTPNHVLINDASGNLSSEAVLSISRGGTNSGTALNNNRVMVSSAGAIVEAAAITASRALESDANGIPVASSVTSTELGYLSGATSNIQTQIDSLMAKANFVDRETPSGAIDGVNTTFTLANTPVAGSEHVYLNGLLQEDGAGNDYTISGATITYLSPPQVGDVLKVSYRKQ